MNILPQILDISSKNFVINQFIYKIKDSLHSFLNNLISNPIFNTYHNIMLAFQQLTNSLSISFFQTLFEAIDNEFKNSQIRKDKFFINKSHVPRTLITIFGTITFNRTLYQNKESGEYYFYLDDVLSLPAYSNYDPLVKAILVQDSVLKNPHFTSHYSSLNSLQLLNSLKGSCSIPKQTLYKFKQEAKIIPIQYAEISHDNTLYVMVDEKWIHQQDKNNPLKRKYIMCKVFVTFTSIERKGKRCRLKGRHVFITSSDNPWKCFMQEISNIYNFEKLTNINLLSDAGSWILSGASELKLYSNNKLTINTCEFHVKQKINRSTTDKDLRQSIANIIYIDEDKDAFIREIDKLIDNATKESRKQKITEYKNYILKHWKGIINMKHSLCKSSMEAHIQHCVASVFSEVPKAYSANYIETYLKFQEMRLNGINILDYYLNTFNSSDDTPYNSNDKFDFSIFASSSNSNIVVPRDSSSLSKALYGLAHP